MPTSLATCVYVIFILWLFYRNSKTSSGVSPSLWIPTIWMGVLASKPIGDWINGNERSLNFNSFHEGDSINVYFFLSLFVVGLFVLQRRRLDWRLAIRNNPWMCLFYIYALLSIVWSDYPFVAFKRWVRDFANVVMILIILTEENPTQAIRQVFLRCAYLLIPLSLLFFKYYRDIGVYFNNWTGEEGICGVTTDKNSLGMLAMLSAVFLTWSIVDTQRCSSWFKWIKTKLPELLVLLVCIWILLAANSKTSLVCFVIAVVVFFASRMSWIGTNTKRWQLFAWSLIILSLLFFFVQGLRAAFNKDLGRSADFTERTDVWNACLNSRTDALIGDGFASFWMTPEGIKLGEELSVNEAHNGYLETYLNGGLIGLALLFAVISAAARNTAKQIAAGSTLAHLYAALYLSSLIYNYTEATFNRGNIIGIVVWLIAMQYPAHVLTDVSLGGHECESADTTQNTAREEILAG